MLYWDKFVNADEIAKELSPFNLESAAIEAGRIMLNRIKNLMETGKSFAFETTLSTRIYRNLVTDARKKGYFVVVIFLWLSSIQIAWKRVLTRVQKGRHNIPDDIIQ